MKIILGDNPFFGVNHLTGSKNLDTEEIRFHNACDVILSAINSDIDLMMLSTHPTYKNLLKKISEKIEKSNLHFNLALVVPFPHTLNNIVAENGYIGLIKFLGIFNIFKSLL